MSAVGSGEPRRVDELGVKAPPAFAIEAEVVDGAFALRLEGELDYASANEVRGYVEGAAGRPLVIDLAGVTFLDSSMLRELLRALTERADRGDRLVLAAVPRPVRRLLELTGTAALFETAPTRADALARVRG
jgi:anti-sigma B factor antagonist